MVNLLKLLFLALVLSLAACGPADQEENNGWDLNDVCGPGEVFEANGTFMCVYSRRSPIIETGFECPPEAEFEHEVGDAIVCSDQEQLPDLALEALGEEYAELVFPFGALPVQRPEYWFGTNTGDWQIDVPGRGAGTCEMSNGGYFGAEEPVTLTFNERGQPVEYRMQTTVLKTWEYDEDGWLLAVRGGAEAIEYERDVFHRVVTITTLENGEPVSVASLEYKNRNRLSQVAYEGERPMPIEWSDDGRTRTSVFDIPYDCGVKPPEVTYDEEGRLSKTENWCEAFGMAVGLIDYDEDGRYLRRQSANKETLEPEGLTEEVTYDETGRATLVRRGGWLQDTYEEIPNWNPGRTEVEWGEVGITRLSFGHDDGGTLLETTFSGACQLSVHDIRYNFTAFGTILPNARPTE